MKLSLAPFAFSAMLAAAPLHLASGPEVQAVLDRISADSMRGNLSFLASDALEGRDTPSRGLDIAAEFIASQFRRAGLEAPVDGSYFQAADFFDLTRPTEGLSLSVVKDGETSRYSASDINLIRTNSAVDLDSLPIFKLTGDSVPDDVAGKAVVLSGRSALSAARALRDKKVALLITTGSGRRPGGARPAHEIVAADQADTPSTPVLTARGDAAKFFDSLPEGLAPAKLTLHGPGPQRTPVKLRNVIGVLRGSDPQLKDSYVIVSAHYDHLGVKPANGDEDSSDRIYNGADDDGSGVVSVIELANALSSLQPRPKRSIVFMTVFGEEKGLLGSQYYGRHPVFPLNRTIANINIEQVGRTDDNDGAQQAAATFTGFTYSDLPQLFAEAGKSTGIKVTDRNPGNDSYFARSDNQALAEAGIPSHTVAVALEFPDYHQPGDEWQKIDYNNMSLVDRMLALGIISLASDPELPKWNESNQNTRKYVNAWKSLHPTPSN